MAHQLLGKVMETHYLSPCKLIKVFGFAAALFASALTANAAQFEFGIVFDGVNASIAAGSDPIGGTVMEAGDSFDLEISAAGEDFWTVVADALNFLPATFLVVEGAERVANITTTLYLDGLQVAQVEELGVAQKFVHIGGQLFDWMAPMQFDEFIIEYELLSSAAATTTITDQPDIVAFAPFFRESYVVYNKVDSSAVPDSGSTLALLSIALLGAIALRRKGR